MFLSLSWRIKRIWVIPPSGMKGLLPLSFQLSCSPGWSWVLQSRWFIISTSSYWSDPFRNLWLSSILGSWVEVKGRVQKRGGRWRKCVCRGEEWGWSTRMFSVTLGKDGSLGTFLCYRQPRTQMPTLPGCLPGLMWISTLLGAPVTRCFYSDRRQSV